MINIKQIKIDALKDQNLKEKISKLLNIDDNFTFNIIKKSIDARNKDQIFYVYEVNVNVKNEDNILKKINNSNIKKEVDENYALSDFGPEKVNDIIIVGSGPAGLFCAYTLCEKGFKPVIIERGKCIEKRTSIVNKFWEENILDENTNVQFGEGGAGTFSDGKLNTLIKDPKHLGKKVLKTFVMHGADEDILYENKPHIGTDVLQKVIISMRNKIIDMGGKFMFDTTLTDIKIENEKIKSIIINNDKEMPCDVLALAIGNSARDTFRLLNTKNILMESKPFAVGLRIMHPQKMIDISQYGPKYYDSLGSASYKLTTNVNGKGIYTFCMCPGGYVVNASSEKEKLVINGMSYKKRDSSIANSAVVVTVNEHDYGNKLFDGLTFQENLEKKAYEIGKKYMPLEYYKDYKNNIVSKNVNENNLKIKGKYTLANLNKIFPDNINDSLKKGIEDFGKKIKGFNSDEAILVGVETRTSSPIRIIRNEYMESNIKGIFPLGEGAGYAGGITSSAVDGIKGAENIIKKYHL